MSEGGFYVMQESPSSFPYLIFLMFYQATYQASEMLFPLSSSLLACFGPQRGRRRRGERNDAVARHIVIIGVDPAGAAGSNTFLLVPAGERTPLSARPPFPVPCRCRPRCPGRAAFCTLARAKTQELSGLCFIGVSNQVPFSWNQ